ncbi:MAG: metallophosphoesterase family protein [bacterium]|jgi:hypothetical protein|nr:metallophosphoesterase family protein [bacterium]
MKHWYIQVCCIVGLVISSCLFAHAHVAGIESVHDTVAHVKARLLAELSPEQLLALNEETLPVHLSAEEQQVLGEGHLHFHIDTPAVVYVFCRDSQPAPFWLAARGFEPMEEAITISDKSFKAWNKPFDAGPVGLGVNSLHREGDHYVVAVVPQQAGAKVAITDLYPGQGRVSVLEPGALPYVDDDDTITVCPEVLRQQALIQVSARWRKYGTISGLFTQTRFPSSAKPDQIVLTWSADPQTSQTIQWRTRVAVERGYVKFAKKLDFYSFSPKKPYIIPAQTEKLETVSIVNDPLCHRHTVTIEPLEPNTTYVYSVGDGSEEGWSELTEFTTAPSRVEPFSFIYMGDAQNGLDRWGTLIHNAYRERPDAAFYILAGDLVNRGNERWDWDDFFYNAQGIFDRRPLVPVLGNHECQDGHPTLYLQLFHLLTNGPSQIEAERAYAFHYSNALFVVMDSNQPPEDQAAWLEEQLAGSEATWKFVVHHHPIYSSAPNRDNVEMRDAWLPLYDKYHVDMVLQGHDHAYLRTYPMKNNQIVDSAKEGTIYVVSVSGTKMYKQADREYTALGMTNVATYQVLDIQISGDRLVYRSYDIDGDLRDEIVIEK